MTQEQLNTLKKKGKLYIKHIGHFEVKPRRKGKINGTLGSNPRYMKRISFTPHYKLKEFINDII